MDVGGGDTAGSPWYKNCRTVLHSASAVRHRRTDGESTALAVCDEKRDAMMGEHHTHSLMYRPQAGTRRFAAPLHIHINHRTQRLSKMREGRKLRRSHRPQLRARRCRCQERVREQKLASAARGPASSFSSIYRRVPFQVASAL